MHLLDSDFNVNVIQATRNTIVWIRYYDTAVTWSSIFSTREI